MRALVCVCVCVCARARVCVWERETESVCVCVCGVKTQGISRTRKIFLPCLTFKLLDCRVPVNHMHPALQLKDQNAEDEFYRVSIPVPVSQMSQAITSTLKSHCFGFFRISQPVTMYDF
jgi:hypothetical protein